MVKCSLISCFVIISGLGLGACSSASSFDGLTAQANLLGDSDEMCGGAPSPAAYSRCAQQRYMSGSAGYNEEEGNFAPGSQSKSLFSAGQ
jgi:hypothetical protein